MNVGDKILKIFLWVGSRKLQKALWRDPKYEYWGDLCAGRQPPAQVQVPREVAQLSVGEPCREESLEEALELHP